MPKNQIGVVFLARKAEGVDALKRFADSYRQVDPGIDHELVITYKGFEGQIELRHATLAVENIPHVRIELPDTGFDIGAYLETSRRLSHEYLVFLNTHSEIVAPGWLARLFQFARKDNVGIAGATGSYESIRDTVVLFREAIWRSIGRGKQYDPRLAYYFDFVLRQYHPHWYNPSGDVVPPAGALPPLLRRSVILAARLFRYRWFNHGGTSLIWRGAPSFDFMQFPGFPNPHIRSNCFMMKRERFLTLGLPSMPTKLHTSLFESGPHSLTARIRNQGLMAVVVGRNGQGYDVKDWWRSETFRRGDQANLLVSDNHTRAFTAMSHGARVTHERTTWGDFLGDPPGDYPDLGIKFAGTFAPCNSEPGKAELLNSPLLK